MKKVTVKVLSFVLVVSMMLGTAVYAEDTVLQTENMIQPRWTYISEITTALDISLGGKATCTTSVYLYSSLNSTCTIEMILQQNDGSGWDDLKSWTISGGSDTDISKNWYIASGYEYRVESHIYVYTANNLLAEYAVTHSPTDSF